LKRLSAAAKDRSGSRLGILALLTAAQNKQIVESLILAEGTVKFYVHAFLEKLQVHSRTQAAARARELNLV
jgi:DNA-binding NarL/FixJ family response regulator